MPHIVPLMDQMGCAAAAVEALDWWDCFEADGLRRMTAGIQTLRAEQQAAVNTSKISL